MINSVYSLNEILSTLTKTVEGSLSGKSIKFSTQFASNIPNTLYGDAEKVKQIMITLLSNAIRYTNSGEILFKVDCINEGNECDLVISVIDTGVGIESNKLNQIFSFNTSLTKVKEFIGLMKGKIVVQSIYGEGSKFTVYLKQSINEPVVQITSLPQEENKEVQPMGEDFLRENGVNLDNSLELLGDMEMYNETLDAFIEENKDRIGRLLNAKNSGDMPTYAIDVHALKSDCKYLGFMHLAELAYDHELKSKEGNIDYVNSHYDELMEEYNRVNEIIRKYKGE